MSLDAYLEPGSQPQVDLDADLQAKLDTLVQRLQQARQDYGEGLTFANSLGAEDALLTGVLASHQPEIEHFVLDTGRLPEETLTLLDQVRRRWPQLTLKVYYPQSQELQAFVEKEGVNAFYLSQELRKACCGVRKLEPLKRALQGKTAWITGLRREQSVTRDQLEYSQWDEGNGLQKLSPLYDWSEGEVWQAIRGLKLPYNRLHDQGYPSIGCAPCTRAVAAGDDPRSGRWWWENPETRECGLHQR
ncbi:phosphoadenylyl-sulfate reductase [Marinospirillum perlucidum]|uniref:phosphoadenylyl-sulfate reductase n=1 Tax=Marinospirillum perlucidum TaxID=1982602 RepID=UPI000DF29215|nr:phosphoadenylyl-sulfate reductase [Marinospirillum perlucidum]